MIIKKCSETLEETKSIQCLRRETSQIVEAVASETQREVAKRHHRESQVQRAKRRSLFGQQKDLTSLQKRISNAVESYASIHWGTLPSVDFNASFVGDLKVYDCEDQAEMAFAQFRNPGEPLCQKLQTILDHNALAHYLQAEALLVDIAPLCHVPKSLLFWLVSISVSSLGDTSEFSLRTILRLLNEGKVEDEHGKDLYTALRHLATSWKPSFGSGEKVSTSSLQSQSKSLSMARCFQIWSHCPADVIDGQTALCLFRQLLLLFAQSSELSQSTDTIILTSLRHALEALLVQLPTLSLSAEVVLQHLWDSNSKINPMIWAKMLRSLPIPDYKTWNSTSQFCMCFSRLVLDSLCLQYMDEDARSPPCKCQDIPVANVAFATKVLHCVVDGKSGASHALVQCAVEVLQRSLAMICSSQTTRLQIIEILHQLEPDRLMDTRKLSQNRKFSCELVEALLSVSQCFRGAQSLHRSVLVQSSLSEYFTEKQELISNN